MDLDTIQRQGIQLQDILGELAAKQQVWNIKKEEVREVLHLIAQLPSLTSFDLVVENASYSQKNDTLLIKFREIPVWPTTKNLKAGSLLKDGPALLFKQNSFGQVIISIVYDFEEVPQEMQKHTLLGYYHPETLSAEELYKIFSRFLAIIVTWNQESFERKVFG